nr:MAG: hypothetical protein 1 [XiangYun luteo-sobemo-like virus 2]
MFNIIENFKQQLISELKLEISKEISKCVKEQISTTPVGVAGSGVGIFSRISGGFIDMIGSANAAICDFVGLNGIVSKTLFYAGVCYGGYSIRGVVSKIKIPSLGRSLPPITYANNSSIIPESIREGSEETLMDHRNGEVIVVGYDRVNNRRVAVGKGCRLFNYLIVPEHVISSAGAIGKVMIQSPNFADKFFELPDNSIRSLICTDVLAINLTNDVWSSISVGTIVIGNIDRCSSVAVVGVNGMGTVGNLTVDANVFGSVIYAGTTRPGYSGGLYCDGNKSLAIHLGGGNVNRGVAIDWIRALVKKTLGIDDSTIRPEDTSDFLREMTLGQGRGRNQAVVKDYGTEDVQIFYKGRYHIVSRTDAKRVWGNSYTTIMGYEDDDYVVESVLADPFLGQPTQSGVSQSVTVSDQCTYDLKNMSIKDCKKLLSQLSRKLSEDKRNNSGNQS